MPSEIQKSLSQKCFSFFVGRNCLLPLAILSFGKQANSFSEESLAKILRAPFKYPVEATEYILLATESPMPDES